MEEHKVVRINGKRSGYVRGSMLPLTNPLNTAVFREFVAKYISIQKQIDRKYQGDEYLVEYLVEQFFTSVNIPQVQAELNDRLPRKEQHAIHRISNRLSDKPRTSGSPIGHL